MQSLFAIAVMIYFSLMNARTHGLIVFIKYVDMIRSYSPSIKTHLDGCCVCPPPKMKILYFTIREIALQFTNMFSGSFNIIFLPNNTPESLIISGNKRVFQL